MSFNARAFWGMSEREREEMMPHSQRLSFNARAFWGMSESNYWDGSIQADQCFNARAFWGMSERYISHSAPVG